MVKFGEFEITREKDKEIIGPSCMGPSVAAAGLVVFLMGIRKK